jgi:hypothetical protein
MTVEVRGVSRSFAIDATRVRRDVAPVVAAEVLLHHGLCDEAILSYLARSWPLDDRGCRASLDAAHILLRREHPRRAASDE